jgi:predicted TIM-barrel fold metal-dependent hydrolase
MPGIARALSRDGSRKLAISESFTFPEWQAAMAEVARRGRHRADGAYFESASAVETTAFAGPGDGARQLGLVTLASPGVEPFAREQARELAKIGNDRLAEWLKDKRGSVAGLATVAAFDPDAVKEAERALALRGMVGLNLGVNRGMRIDSPSLRPVLEFAASSGAPVYLPAAYSSVGSDAPYRALGRSGELLGASADSAAHAVQLIFGGVLDRHPTLRVVLGQMGAGTPYWMGQINETYESLASSAQPVPRRAPMEYFGTNIYLSTAGMGPDTLRYCSAMLGEGTVLPALGPHAPELAALDPQLRARVGRLTDTRAERMIRQA